MATAPTSITCTCTSTSPRRSARATACTRGRRSAPSATAATRGAATSTSSYGVPQAGTTAASRSTRSPPCKPGIAGLRLAGMAGYTIRTLEEIPDVLGDYPGEMRMSAASDLGTEQVGFTWRRMPPLTGGKGSYGHRHKTQEEVYFVASGTLQFKLEDEVVDVPEGTVVRVSPEVARSVWNKGPDDAVVIVVSTKSEDPRSDTESVEDFWPEGDDES